MHKKHGDNFFAHLIRQPTGVGSGWKMSQNISAFLHECWKPHNNKKKHLASTSSITQLASSQVTGYKKGMQKLYRLFLEDIIPMYTQGQKDQQNSRHIISMIALKKYRYFIRFLNKSMAQPNQDNLHCSHSPTLERHNELDKATQKTERENKAKETRRG